MILRWLGRLFITAGIFILLFLGYQLYGTNFITEKHQQTLAKSFEAQLTAPAPPVEPKPDFGDGIARIEIPKIGVDWIVVEGVSTEALKKGPGHYPGTAYPGETGNVVISGHRTTYGAPFFRVDELAPGDELRLASPNGTFTYRVTESRVVAPTEISVIASTEESKLTLTTCHPRFSARQRLIIVAELEQTRPRHFE
jgi:sortase A